MTGMPTTVEGIDTHLRCRFEPRRVEMSSAYQLATQLPRPHFSHNCAHQSGDGEKRIKGPNSDRGLLPIG
jgi:hypothetical protein